MKTVLMMLCILMNFPAYAISSDDVYRAGFNNLTEAQKAAIVAQVDQQAAPTPKLDVVERWANMGTNIGRGLASSAKELGVAVNDFANSPVGKTVTFLLVWNFFW